MRKLFVLFFVVISMGSLFAQTEYDFYLDLLRLDIRAKKVALINESMQFTEAQAEVFWPIYKEYALEQEKITDERIKLIKAYLKFYENMEDATAQVLAKKSMEIEQQRLDLKKKYFKKFEEALTPKMAVKLYQIQNMTNSLIKLQVDAELPLLNVQEK